MDAPARRPERRGFCRARAWVGVTGNRQAWCNEQSVTGGPNDIRESWIHPIDVFGLSFICATDRRR